VEIHRLLAAAEGDRYFAKPLETIEALGLAGFNCESLAIETTTDWGIQLAKIGAIAAIYLHLFRALRLFSSR